MNCFKFRAVSTEYTEELKQLDNQLHAAHLLINQLKLQIREKRKELITQQVDIDNLVSGDIVYDTTTNSYYCYMNANYPLTLIEDEFTDLKHFDCVENDSNFGGESICKNGVDD